MGFVRALARFITTLLSTFLGHWQPPRWLAWVGRRLAALAEWAKGRPGPAFVGALALVGVATGGFYGHRWWKNRPRPETITVVVTSPEATRLEDSARPFPLVLQFSASVAPLAEIGKPVKSGIEMTPRVEGAWRWDGDKRLLFSPRADWPVGQDLKIKLAPRGLLRENIRLDEYSVTAKTAPFSAAIAEVEFYQDPVDPDLKKVVAHFSFSHPVDPVSFEKHLKVVEIDPATKKERALGVRTSYGKWKGTAFVHTDPIPVPKRDRKVIVTLEKGVKAARGGNATDEAPSKDALVPGLYSHLKIGSAVLAIAQNARLEPEQVVVVETTAAATTDEVARKTSAWVLPLHHPDSKPEERKHPYVWSAADAIGQDVLRKSAKLPLESIPTEHEHATLHSFKYKGDVGRWVFVQVEKGIKGFGGYELGETFVTSARVPEYPKELKILQSGAILSTAGEHKVPLYTRDVEAVRFEIGRVLPGQLHHLVSQNSGTFAEPTLLSKYMRFSAENLSEVVAEVRELDKLAPGKAQYQAYDLGKYLEPGGPERRRGLFFFRAQSWDPLRKVTTGKEDARLILVTDLGIVVKAATDGSNDLFVQSIHKGAPVAGAKVELVGKNGLAVLSSTTDAQGHATFPSTRGLERERAPVLWRVHKDNDLSFIPFAAGERMLNLSRFDVGGVQEAEHGEGLSAYLFSDRGLYRPGEEIRFGLIVKPHDWKASVRGVPLEAVLSDPRGQVIRREKLRLSASGFEEVKHTTSPIAPTGVYTLALLLARDGQPQSQLGQATVRVREFEPDRMKISVRLSEEHPGGWVTPDKLKGRVHLENLFGTPAGKRQIRGSIQLSPVVPSFAGLRDYRFFDPARAKESQAEALADAQTSDAGDAELDLGLQKYANATYRLRFLAAGFEAEGGRSVAGEASAIVSPLAFLLGWKPDGDLRYVHKGARRVVDVVAVGPDGKRTAARDLSLVKVELRHVSVLTKQPSGLYKYESVKKEVELGRSPLSVAAEGHKLALPTDKPGEFAMVVRDALGKEILRVEYSVAGAGNLSRALDRNAELELKLSKTDYAAGEDIELHIKAPYTGSGLIAIEREKVISFKWFKASETATVEHIRLPESVEGNAYVSVAFVRDFDSDEVFMSPLSYAVAPFSVSRARRMMKVAVETPELVKPGEPLKIRYKSDRPARIALFAVDEGILRVAAHQPPDPLSHFFKKRALGVRTSQILDLVLPEFEQLVAASAAGGDAEGALGAHVNPFRRRHDPPVAYWSGLVESGPKWREATYEVPDFFNGSLQVFAVAVGPDAIGTTERSLHVRGDFVLSPTLPAFLAPGDEVEVPVTVSNNVSGSGKGVAVTVKMELPPELEAVGPASEQVPVDELREGTVRFRVRARGKLGPGRATFLAEGAGKRARLAQEVSVRPAVGYESVIAAGRVKGDVSVPVGQHKKFPELRRLEAGVSRLPLGIASALGGYLAKYPHGCTEQLTSQAVSAVVLASRPALGGRAEEAQASLGKAIEALRSRQNDEGGFGLWASSPRSAPGPSVYALHALLEAKQRGQGVPADLAKRGQSYLIELAGGEPQDLADARLRAYAIYVLTRGGTTTLRFAHALERKLEDGFAAEWKQDLAAAYLASAHALLHRDADAERLIAGPALGKPAAADPGGYYDATIHDAQLFHLLARHFPERAKKMAPAALDALVGAVAGGRYSTLSSAYTMLALDAWANLAETEGGGGGLSIAEVGGAARALDLPPGLLPFVAFSEAATALRFAAAGDLPAFYTVVQAGFDVALPDKAVAQGLEVVREYTDAQGKPVTEVRLGDEVQVHLRIRSLGKEPVWQVALVDLLPAGFEVVVQPPPAASPEGEGAPGAPAPGGEGEGEGEGGPPPEGDGGEAPAEVFSLPISLPKTTWTIEHGDVREDRVVLYGTALPDAKEFIYAMKAQSAGKVAVPPVSAEAMYQRATMARSAAGKPLVVAADKKK